MRPLAPRLIFALLVGAAGIGALVVLTDLRTLPGAVIPLGVFIILSFVVKRAGVRSDPDTLHSLVGIVDLAAILIFSPLPGAWVPALSSLLYVVINLLETPEPARPWFVLIESPLGNAGIKGLMGLAAGAVYLRLGGSSPPSDLNLGTVVPTGAAMLTWFLLDNLAWGIWETLRVGWAAFYRILRETLSTSLLVELVPLPFAMVIAVVYTVFGGITRPIFILMALALVEVAFVIQRYTDALERVERRTDELVALNEFGQALARAGFDPERLIELLMDYARRVSEGDCYRLELLNSERTAVRLWVESRGGSQQWVREERPPSNAVVYLRDNPASILARDLARDRLPFEADEVVDGRPAGAAIYLPLFAGQDVIGVLTVLSARAGRLYRHTARNLSSMTSQAAIALENANLYAVERRRAGQLALVSEVSRRVAQFLDLDELLQQVVREIRDRFGYSNVHVFARNDDDSLVFRASTHPDWEKWRAASERLPAGQGIAGWVLATGEPLLAPDVTQEPHYQTGPVGLINTRSELAVPLVVGDKALGVLDVQSEQVGRFGQEDLFVLQTLAAQIAIAIEDARLYAAQKEEAWYLNVLLQVSENLAETATLDEALETIVRITPILVGVARCAVFLYDPAHETLYAVREYGLKPEVRARFRELRFRLDADPPNAWTEMRQNRAPVTVEALPDNKNVDSEIVRTFELDSLVLTPLIYRGEFVGAMVVDQGPRPRRFNPHEIQVLMGISNQAAVAVENARLNEAAEENKRLDYEIGLARRIQTAFLPPCCPTIPGYLLSAAWRAAREVSGDFYDFMSLPNGRFGLTIADVSDKGMPAALFMVLTRTLLRAMALGKPTPKEALERANDLILSDSRTDMFATAFYAILDAATGEIAYVNAGHNPPLWYHHAQEELTEVRGHGLALGVLPGIQLPERHIRLAPGDTLLLYTDGVTDTLNPGGEEYGASRLADLVAANNHLGADELVEEILSSVYDFSHGAPQFDDITLVVLKREMNGNAGLDRN